MKALQGSNPKGVNHVGSYIQSLNVVALNFIRWRCAMRITIKTRKLNRDQVKRLEALGFKVTTLLTINE